jgi:hypothetical protein
MMTHFRHSIRSRFFLGILLLPITVAVFTEVSICQADQPDTALASDEMKPSVEKILEIKSRAGDEKTARSIIIDEEGITLNGKKIQYEDLEDSIVSTLIVEGGSIIKFGEPVDIGKDEIVDGDLASFLADVTVAGTVTGDVAVFGADLHLLSSGIIKGDVFTFGGTIHQEPGGQIRGQRAGVLPKTLPRYGPIPIIIDPLENLVAFGIPLLFFIIMSFLFLALAGFFVPRHIERIGAVIETAPLKSILLGFVVLLVAPPLFLLLIVTVIGIPVALIAQPIVYFVAGIMGFAGVSFFIGTKIQPKTGTGRRAPLSQIFLGALILQAVLILAWLFPLGGRFFAAMFWFFFLIGLIIFLVASMAGLGAVVWTRFGIRPLVNTHGEVPPVPPPFDDEDQLENDSGATAPA